MLIGFADNQQWTGRIRITINGVVYDEFPNLITDAGRDLLVQGLSGVDTQIKYLAWGNDNTAPAAGDLLLGTELGRKQITTYSDPSGNGNLLTTTYVSPLEANAQLEELGWFAGAAAGAGLNSGVLVARVLWSHLKTNLESLQVDRTDTLT